MRNSEIVIIHDDQEMLGGLERILIAGGYLPIAFNATSLTLDVVARCQPDAILLELKMPFKNGFEIADDINRLFAAKRIPIIGISEFLTDEFTFLLNLCGIDGQLMKPFNPLDVIWAIENVVGEGDLSDKKRSLAWVG